MQKHTISFSLELRDNASPGTYVALEGIDGSGKTTQIEKLASYFSEKGKEVVIVREPSNEGVVGTLIREILRGEEKIPEVAFQYLFAADRTIQIENKIIPSLEAGKVVISDRCFWSALPYGMMDKGLFQEKKEDTELLLAAYSILSMYHRFIKPDFTFYLAISARTACDRLEQMDKAKEIYEKEEKLGQLARGYDWLCEHFPDAITKVDAEQAVDTITKEILERIKN